VEACGSRTHISRLTLGVLPLNYRFRLALYQKEWQNRSMDEMDEMDEIELTSREIAEKELQNPQTLPERLVEIEQFFWSEDYDECHQVARHPNCPPALFIRLIPHFPDAAAENPAWELLLIEGVMGQLFPKLGVFFAQLQKESLTSRWILLLQNHPYPPIVQATKMHVHVAGEVETKNEHWQTELADILVRDLRRDSRLVELQKYNVLPDWVNQRLPYPMPHLPAPTPKPRIHPIYPEIPPTKKEWKIAKDTKNWWEQRDVAIDTRSPELLRFLAGNAKMRDATKKVEDVEDPFEDDDDDGIDILLIVLANPATPQDVIQTLSAQFAQIKNLSDYEISRLLQCERVPYSVRNQHRTKDLGDIAYQCYTRTPIYEVFKSDPDAPFAVRREAMLCYFSETKGELASCLTLMQVESPAILKRKETSAYWHLRLGVALNPLTPDETLTQLSKDGNRYVRAVARERLASSVWRFTPQ
jgi:hypothetical protein